MHAPVASIGHNISAQFGALDARATELAAGADRCVEKFPEIPSEDVAGQVQAALEQLRVHAKDVEAARVAEKQPHVEAGKEIDGRYGSATNPAPGTLQARLSAAMGVYKRLLDGWLQRKEAKLAEERRLAQLAAEQASREAAELARKAEEAARQNKAPVAAQAAAEQAQARAQNAAQAAADAARAKPSVKGNLSSRSIGYRTVRKAVVADLGLALRHYGSHPSIKVELEKLANAELRGGAESVPGFDVVTERIVA